MINYNALCHFIHCHIHAVSLFYADIPSIVCISVDEQLLLEQITVEDSFNHKLFRSGDLHQLLG